MAVGSGEQIEQDMGSTVHIHISKQLRFHEIFSNSSEELFKNSYERIPKEFQWLINKSSKVLEIVRKHYMIFFEQLFLVSFKPP